MRQLSIRLVQGTNATEYYVSTKPSAVGVGKEGLILVERVAFGFGPDVV